MSAYSYGRDRWIANQYGPRDVRQARIRVARPVPAEPTADLVNLGVWPKVGENGSAGLYQVRGVTVAIHNNSRYHKLNADGSISICRSLLSRVGL